MKKYLALVLGTLGCLSYLPNSAWSEAPALEIAMAGTKGVSGGQEVGYKASLKEVILELERNEKFSEPIEVILLGPEANGITRARLIAKKNHLEALDVHGIAKKKIERTPQVVSKSGERVSVDQYGKVIAVHSFRGSHPKGVKWEYCCPEGEYIVRDREGREMLHLKNIPNGMFFVPSPSGKYAVCVEGRRGVYNSHGVNTIESKGAEDDAWLGGEIRSIRFSPESSHFATVEVFDLSQRFNLNLFAADGTPIWRKSWKGDDYVGAGPCAISPQLSYVAVDRGTQGVALYSLSGAALWEINLPLRTSGVNRLLFSEDEQYLFAVTATADTYLLDVARGLVKWEWHPDKLALYGNANVIRGSIETIRFTINKSMSRILLGLRVHKWEPGKIEVLSDQLVVLSREGVVLGRKKFRPKSFLCQVAGGVPVQAVIQIDVAGDHLVVATQSDLKTYRIRKKE